MIGVVVPSDTGMRRTLVTLGGALLLAAPVPALRSQTLDAQAQLARAQLIEEQEGDLRSAEREYRALLDNKDAGAVHAEAALRLGRMLWRLDKKDDGRPFLERAVAAGGAVAAAATAVLQGQGPEGKQAQEIAQQAKDAIDRLTEHKPPVGDPAADLTWLGPAAMPTILHELEALRAGAIAQLPNVLTPSMQGVLERLEDHKVPPEKPNAVDVVRGAVHLARAVWAIGGADAERWLRAAAADSNLQWRRIVALAAKGAHESLLPVAGLLLDDRDPDGYVPVFALQLADRLPLERVVQLFASNVPFTRESARQSLERRDVWRPPGGAAADAAMQPLEPLLVKALQNPDPQVARQAFRFLGSIAAASLRASLLYLQWLPRVPVFEASEVLNRGVSLAPLVDAARALGAVNPADGRDERRWALLQPISAALSWDRVNTVEGVCQLVALGYERIRQGVSWLPDVVRQASSDAELQQIAALLPVCSQPSELSRAFAERILPATAVEPLQKRLELVLANEPPSQSAARNKATVRDARSSEAYWLLLALGRTGSTSVLPVLRATIERRPDLLPEVAEAAHWLSLRNDDPSINALLRDLMVMEPLQPNTRDALFAELARRGDVEAIPRFARAYQLGLQASTRLSVAGVNIPRTGVGWLSSYSENGQSHKLHGFDDAQLTAAWRAVLEGPAVIQALADASRVGRDLPRVALQPVTEALLAHVDQLNEAKVSQYGNTNWQRSILLTVTGMVTDSAEDAPCRAIVARLCAHPQWGKTVFEGLVAPQVIAAMADDLRKLLGGPNGLEAMQRLNYGGITLTTDELLTCLRGPDNRYEFLEQLRPDAPPEIVREVVGMLKTGDAHVRAGACEALGRFLSADAVPALLPMLRDPDASVVKVATEALDKIRQYQEQKAYWDQFQSGITTGRESATAKLLIQAKPGAPKEQRLLALRSLAALGAPEALPYLIEWTHDADAEVAQAAKDAIGTIHQHAGVK
jgi:HEAT repeat protein